MEPIIVKEQAKGQDWQCAVTVGAGGDATQHTVTVERAYWQQLTGGKTDVAALVQKSFEFLLQREPKTSILRSFNLRVISNYFPEYESKIKKMV